MNFIISGGSMFRTSFLICLLLFHANNSFAWIHGKEIEVEYVYIYIMYIYAFHHSCLEDKTSSEQKEKPKLKLLF